MRVPGLRGTALGRNLAEGLTGAGERVALGVDQALDFKHQFDIAAAIEALAGSALVGLELGKLRLPKAQDIGFDAADAGYIANLEVEAVGDGGVFSRARFVGSCVAIVTGWKTPRGEGRLRSRGSIGQNLHRVWSKIRSNCGQGA